MGSVGSQIKNDTDKIKNWLDEEGGKGGVAKPIDIDKIQDKTLEGVEGKIRNLRREQLYVFDKDDNLIEGYQGDSDSVSFPLTVLDYEGATVTHGHPKGMAEFGGTFSFADVRNMLDSKWKEHRATASGQGEMNYIMRRTNNANPEGLRRQINTDYAILKRNLTDTYRDAYTKAISDGKTASQAKHEARQQAVGTLNAYYKRTFSQYGFEYVTRKKNYRYGR